MSLTQVLDEIKTLKQFAEEDVQSGPMETLNARRGRKNQAIERLKLLKREYSKDLLRSAVFIVAAGAGRNEFATLAVEKFGCFSTDPDTFYADLAGRVPPTLYLGREGVSNIFDVLGRHLEDKMGELDINEYNQLLFKANYSGTLNSQDQYKTLVTRAVNAQIGAEIAGIQAVASLVDEAIKREHAEKITPILLTTGDNQLAMELMKDLERLTPRVFLTVTGKSSKAMKSVDGVLLMSEANEESVQQTLTEIRNNLKK